MKKAIVILLIILILLSLIAALTGNFSDWSFKSYMKYIQNPPQPPPLPVEPEPTWENAIDWLKFIGLCIAYPFDYLTYLMDTVLFFFQGLPL